MRYNLWHASFIKCFSFHNLTSWPQLTFEFRHRNYDVCQFSSLLRYCVYNYTASCNCTLIYHYDCKWRPFIPPVSTLTLQSEDIPSSTCFTLPSQICIDNSCHSVNILGGGPLLYRHNGYCNSFAQQPHPQKQHILSISTIYTASQIFEVLFLSQNIFAEEISHIRAAPPP